MDRRRLLALGAGLPLVAAGCGGDSKDSPGTAAPAATPTAGSATTASAGRATPATQATPGTAPAAPSPAAAKVSYTLVEFPVTRGSSPHDVAPAQDGGVWYTGQRNGTLGHLDPKTRAVTEVSLGQGSAPHGVIVASDGAAWITDGGRNAILRVAPGSRTVDAFPLPSTHPGANLNTAAFDATGVLWFTGQSGVYGRVIPQSGKVEAFDAPRGRGPYGICATPGGEVYYASLAGSHIARIDRETGKAEPIEPPTAGQGARRVWSDSSGRIWVSEWNAGQVGRYDPADLSGKPWKEWKLPGANAQCYAVYVDDRDQVWLTDFGGNAILRFDPAAETFESFPLSRPGANVRQLLGRPGEMWGAESGLDALVAIRSVAS